MGTVAVEISADDCSALSRLIPNFGECGVAYQDGVLTVPAEIVELVTEALTDLPALRTAALAAQKIELKAAIDQQAENERSRYLTPGSGQAMTYQAKLEEARALAQDPKPKASTYPLLAAEIGVSAPSLEEVGAAVLSAYQRWQQVGAAIERVRLGAKAAVEAAATAEEAQRILAAIDWP